MGFPKLFFQFIHVFNERTGRIVTQSPKKHNKYSLKLVNYRRLEKSDEFITITIKFEAHCSLWNAFREQFNGCNRDE